MLCKFHCRLAKLLDYLPNAVILAFNGEVVAYLSPCIAERLGYAPCERRRLDYRALMREHDWQTLQTPDGAPHGGARLMHLTLQGKGDARVEAEVRADRWRNGKEQWLVLWGVATPQEEAPDGATEPRAHDAQSIRFNEGYGASFSHEVRNPLSALIGLVGLLQETPLNEEQQRLVATISGVADHLIMLLNDMIDSSRFQMGKIIIKRAPFALHPLIASLFNRYELLSPHLHFTFEYDESLPEEVLGDSHRVTQILTNLLSNAVKFTPSGKITLRVKNLHNSRDVLFAVQDTGIGIGKDFLERLFSPFERGKEVAQTAGAGLGLFICKQLVEMHGGTIQAFSRPGEGCTIQATLPLISADLAAAATSPVAKGPSAPTPHPNAATQAGANAQRILVVDDNRINVLVVRKFFDKWGIPNDAAFSGEEAIRMVNSTPYALVFMDLRMPGMDGYATCQRIRGLAGAKAQVPIVALTASTEAGVKERIKKAGMNGYLFKPFKTEQLREIVDRYVTSSAQEAPSAAAPNA